ncbi:hypothetical protein BBJ28_00000359 [Nothophytophthora sp. Chile5]|nr:hypothetical protein BBJ28_00000359 [Nothophytophthora sp. Chile5]
MASMEVQFKGQTYPLALAEGSTATVGELQEQIERALGVPKDAQRLFQKRRRVDCSDATRLLSDACDCGAQAPPLYLVAGASAEQIEEMRHTHSAVQAEQQIRVGVLAEMPPDGKVGVDPVCVLGLNQNKGQKILLRLRTDDLLGFRKFLRYVLLGSTWSTCHYPHDSKFYQLMRLVERECSELDWTSSQGATVGGAHAAMMAGGDALEGSQHSVGHRLGSGLGSGLSTASRLLDTEPAPTQHIATLPPPIPHAEASKPPSPATHVQGEESEMEDVMAPSPSPPSQLAPPPAFTPQVVAHYSAGSVAKAVSLLHKIVSNIISHPADAKFRSIRKANRLFDGQVARFPECLEFLLALGFEDQTEKFVLVREDPALLWIGRSKLEVMLPAVA